MENEIDYEKVNKVVEALKVRTSQIFDENSKNGVKRINEITQSVAEIMKEHPGKTLDEYCQLFEEQQENLIAKEEQENGQEIE
jgi:hypothetical protein